MIHSVRLNQGLSNGQALTVWIGELQWRLSHGYGFKTNPVLEPLDNIECRDALISFVGEDGDSSHARSATRDEAQAGQTPAAHTLRFLKSPQMPAPPAPLTADGGGSKLGAGKLVGDASNLGSDPRPQGAGSDPNLRIQLTKAVEACWPWASIVIGNPPFLGDKKMRSELGDDYTEALRKAYAGRVPGGADLVTFWFEKARSAIEKHGLDAAGLVATQSVRAGANRKVLLRIAETTRIYEAWSDEPWVNNGAAVRVSLVCFGWGGNEVILNGQHVPRITADLGGSGDLDLTTAKPLAENASVAFQGPVKVGAFDIPGEVARRWLTRPNVNGQTNTKVLKPWANGQDIAKRASDTWIIDFGVNMSERDASEFEEPFNHVVHFVKPQRKAQSDVARKRNWWIHGRSGEDYRLAAIGLSRYLTTPRVAKHRYFVWLPIQVWPDSRLYAITRADDLTFGILSSRMHEAWSLANASMHGVGNDPTYNARSCFETFPFPIFQADQGHQAMVGRVSGATSKRPKAVERPVPALPAPGLRTSAEASTQAAKRLTCAKLGSTHSNGLTASQKLRR